MVSKGIVFVKSRPGCFVVLPRETGEKIQEAVRMFKGLPLALVDGQDVLYIVNMAQRFPGFWSGLIEDREEMLKHAAKMIDLYLEWKTLGFWPRWFLDLKAKAKNGG